jgi:hypothetical protein
MFTLKSSQVISDISIEYKMKISETVSMFIVRASRQNLIYQQNSDVADGSKKFKAFICYESITSDVLFVCNIGFG